jgi:zona occludens toxin (predicted ATPase)
MLSIVTGTPGAGKTLRAIQLILERLEKNKNLKEGEEPFKIYTNIEGINIPGLLPAPDDWRECESPALWVIDEAQYMFPATGARGLDQNPIISEIATHRHLGIDLMLITQHPGLISSHVRKFVGRHEHLDRRFGSRMVTLYMADNLMNVDSGLKSNEHDTWSHPKKLFQYYKSASTHINNRRLPGGLKKMIAFLGLLICGTAYAAYNSVGFFTGKSTGYAEFEKQKNNRESFQIPDSSTKSIGVPVDETLNIYAGCIVSNLKCRCFFEDGAPADMTFQECVDIEDNLPIRINTSFKTN